MHSLARFVAYGLFVLATLFVGIFPRAYPRLVNRWYNFLGFKTRLVEEDFTGWSIRSISFVLFAVGTAWIVYDFLR